jgi:hypothetical protein
MTTNSTQSKPESRRRNRAPSAQEIERTIKAAAAAGHPVSEIRREPGGVVRFFLGQPTIEQKSGSALAEWKRKREAAKSVSGSV